MYLVLCEQNGHCGAFYAESRKRVPKSIPFNLRHQLSTCAFQFAEKYARTESLDLFKKKGCKSKKIFFSLRQNTYYTNFIIIQIYDFF